MARPAQAQTVSEYAAKAAFIYNVTRFSSLTHVHPVLRLCVFGRDPFDGALDSLEGRSVGQSKLTIAYPRSAKQALERCQILFISASEEASIGELTEAAGAAALLTISDIKGAARRGVMLELALENKRIAFECNCKAMRAAGIALNASVLRLARAVY
ncbi:YfiR family protein [Massilia sp. H6]|uniref:YfiR family protein n=1 Tax=Massilia sp. H6 TaxID=2970464 RepID=UPI00216A28D8|nr:YfiR family protein [Massilia sp. H6]UVW30065.1 YfiR family protein [Massilia sp. H6]